MATEVASPASYIGHGSAPSTPTSPPPSSGSYGMHPPPMPVGTPNSMMSRRPPRKSTLTQQQKLQKRQRATQDQLSTLEIEFNKNPTPAAEVRLQIAEEINMTERSVQIWFQNRFVVIRVSCVRSLFLFTCVC